MRLGSFCYDVSMILITGAASSGKTSAVKLLKEQLPADKFDIHDIDEADKWTNDYEGWRDAKIEYWLKQSIENRKQGIETILCGIIYPKDVVKPPSYSVAQPVEYILLDASPETIQDRYYKKMQPWLSRQKEISKELKSEFQNKPGIKVLDTTNTSSNDIARTIAKQLSVDS